MVSVYSVITHFAISNILQWVISIHSYAFSCLIFCSKSFCFPVRLCSSYSELYLGTHAQYIEPGIFILLDNRFLIPTQLWAFETVTYQNFTHFLFHVHFSANSYTLESIGSFILCPYLILIPLVKYKIWHHHTSYQLKFQFIYKYLIPWFLTTMYVISPLPKNNMMSFYLCFLAPCLCATFFPHAKWYNFFQCHLFWK